MNTLTTLAAGAATVNRAPAPLTREQAMALVDAVMERQGLAVAAAAHQLPSGEWRFEATCQGPPDEAAFTALAHQVLGGAVGFTAAPLPAIDWVGRSLEGLGPVVAGGFWIHGSHHAGPAPAGLTPIRIDAATAFGTGHHATTTGCLDAFADLLRRARPRRVLDLGSGTGVLAIAAAMRLRRPVLAADIDPIAVQVTASNARANGVANRIVTIRADGLNHPEIANAGPFDLVFANILAGPLVRLAPAVSRRVVRGGAVILSGLLQRQAPRVIAAYADNDLVLEKKAARDGWATLTLTKR